MANGLIGCIANVLVSSTTSFFAFDRLNAVSMFSVFPLCANIRRVVQYSICISIIHISQTAIHNPYIISVTLTHNRNNVVLFLVLSLLLFVCFIKKNNNFDETKKKRSE